MKKSQNLKQAYPMDIIRDLFREWGRKGGQARSRGMTRKQRVLSARRAARARWGREKNA